MFELTIYNYDEPMYSVECNSWEDVAMECALEREYADGSFRYFQLTDLNRACAHQRELEEEIFF